MSEDKWTDKIVKWNDEFVRQALHKFFSGDQTIRRDWSELNIEKSEEENADASPDA